MTHGLRLGMPFWGFEGWQGGLYPRDARPATFLRHYARVFGAVEGNTTFYASPGERTVERWARGTPDAFRFCLKLPRTITHDAALRDVRAETTAFLDRVRPLRERLGPLMIQLPPSFGPRDLGRLEEFLGALPGDLRFAVELRDPDLLSDGVLADTAADLLVTSGVGRVVMDTRPLRDGPGDHPDVLAARHKKPDLPVREEALSEDPIVRIVFHPEPAVNECWLDRWSRILVGWLGRGISPLVFVHSPSNRESPAIARDLHRRVADRAGLPAMPDWPGESGESDSGQLALW